MKTSLTIQLAAKTFQVETIAYDYLKSFLFHLSEENRETAREFETLLAIELTNELIDSSEIVTLAQAQNAVARVNAMQPNVTTPENPSGHQTYDPHYIRTDRRLLRNAQNRVFGGVCSGLGLYYHTNPVLFRILFVILFFVTSGGFFLAYLIMWIALPKKQPTPTETTNSNEELTTKQANQEKNGFGSVLKKIFGVFFILIGISTVSGLVFSGVVFSNFHAGMPSILPSFWGEMLPIYGLNTGMIATLVYSVLTAIGIPFLLLLYAGLKWVFGPVTESRTVVLTLLGIWVVAIALTTTTGIRMAGDMKDVYTSEQETQMIAPSDTIYLSIDESKILSDSVTSFQFNTVQVIKHKHTELVKAKPHLRIVPSSTNEAKLTRTQTARGNGMNQAEKNASQIDYNFVKRGDTIVFDPYFEVGDKKQWQSQQLELVVEFPENSVFYIDESLLHILTDMPNHHDMWVGDVVDQYWKVTSKGLELVPKKGEKTQIIDIQN